MFVPLIPFILLPLFTLPLITFIIPFSAAWRLWVIFISFLVTVNMYHYNGHDYNFRLGLEFIQIFAVFASILLCIRYFFHRFWHPKSLEGYKISKKNLAVVDKTIAPIFGLFASIILIIPLSFIFESQNNGYTIHASAGIIALIFALISLCSIKKFTKTSLFLATLSLTISLVSFWGMNYPEIVTNKAKVIAGKNPYCIALNNQENTPLYSEELLTFFTMTKNRGVHHVALLVKENSKTKPYHWSYKHMEFRPGIVNWSNHNKPSIACIPKSDFLENLPQKNDDKEFYIRGKEIIIPSEYNPYISANYFSLSIAAPDFKTVSRKKHAIYPSMEIRSRNWIQSLANSQKESAKTNDNIHIFDNKQGQVKTFIQCYDTRKTVPQCQHRFYRNGAMYSFDHDKEHIPIIEEMQDTLYNLFQDLGFNNLTTKTRAGEMR